MKYTRFLLAALLTVSATVMGQDLKSGYYNENYLYRHELNPAFGNEKGYFAMPFFLGNMNVTMGGNVGVKNFLYNRNGKTVTFLHPDVSSGDFKIKDNNKITEELKFQLLGFGFKGMGGYNTFEINMRQNMGFCFDGDMLRMFKDGVTNKTYDLSNMGATFQSYVEIGLGHSHQIDEHWRVGGKFKFLVGAARADLIVDKAEVNLGEDAYSALVDARIEGNFKGLKYKYDNDGNFDGIDDIDNFGIGGFGVAFDLGAEYKLDDHWSFSAAVVDLGFINWNTNEVVGTEGKQFNTGEYTFNVNEDNENKFSNVLDDMGDELSDLATFKNRGNQGAQKKMLGATMNLGANWRASFYDKLTFGLTNSTRMQGKYTWTDFRLSANVRPCKGFAATANMSLGTYGFGFGWMLDFQAKKGIDFFLGMDRLPGKFTKEYVPLSSNLQFSMGIGFPF